MEQGPCQSFASSRDVSKVYHPVIRLINGTAVEQRTWLKCKYPKCKWLCWITGNYKVSSWDLSGFVNGCRVCKQDSFKKDASGQRREASPTPVPSYVDVGDTRPFGVQIRGLRVSLVDNVLCSMFVCLFHHKGIQQANLSLHVISHLMLKKKRHLFVF